MPFGARHQQGWPRRKRAASWSTSELVSLPIIRHFMQMASWGASQVGLPSKMKLSECPSAEWVRDLGLDARELAGVDVSAHREPRISSCPPSSAERRSAQAAMPSVLMMVHSSLKLSAFIRLICCGGDVAKDVAPVDGVRAAVDPKSLAEFGEALDGGGDPEHCGCIETVEAPR